MKYPAKHAIVILTNIPSPYRGYLFKEFANIARARNVLLHVYYCRSTEDGRNFSLSNAFSGYQSTIDLKGLYFSIRGFHIHLNPSIIFALIGHLLRNHTIVLGGCWWSLNNIVLIIAHYVLSICPWIKYSGHVGLWVEDNIQKAERSPLLNRIKGSVYSASDFFWVPGRLARKIVLSYISREVTGWMHKAIILLPNLVDLDKFANPSNRILYDHDPIRILIVARLVEASKGLGLFLRTVSLYPSFNSKFTISIIGEGKDRSSVEKTIEQSQLALSVELLGNLPYNMIGYHMVGSDVFILPSLADPSPLSLVEAAFSELPLIASKYCGNHSELILDNYNGRVFDPCQPKTVYEALDWIFDNRSNLREIGKKSRQVALKSYEPSSVLENLLHAMISNKLL